MRNITISLVALFGLLPAYAAGPKINAATNVDWTKVTGTTAPAATCNSTIYGEPYTNTATGDFYVCSSSGWVLVTGGGGGGISGSATSGFLAIGTGAASIGPSLADYGISTAGTFTFPKPAIFNDGTGVAGTAALQQGTATSNSTTSVTLTAPTSVTSYRIVLPGVHATGSNTFLSCTAADPSVCTWAAGGSGTTVNVNGSSVSSPNFNGSTPAAGSNGKNVTWQVSSSSVSAEIVGDGTSTHFLNGIGTYTTPAGSGGGSVNVVYASSIAGVTTGVAVAAGSSAVGTVDSASALNTAIAGGNIDLEVDSGFALSTSLIVHSNTTIHCTSPQFGFIMQVAANTPVIQNANPNAPTTASGTGGFIVSNQTDNNIRIIGCMLNANSTQAVTGSGNISGTPHTTDPGTGLMVVGLQLAGINGLWVEKNELYDSGQWGITTTNDSNVFLNWNFIHNPLPLTALKNTSGIMINGPELYVEANGNIINSGDSAVEIDTETCTRGGESDCQITFWKWGPIQYVHFEGTTFQNSNDGFLLLSASERMDDIDIGNTAGATCDNMLVAEEYSGLSGFGHGNIGKVRIHGFTAQTSGSCNVYSGPYPMIWGLNADAVTIEGVKYTNPAVTWPILTTATSQGLVKTLSLSNWLVTTTSSTFSPSIVFLGTSTVTNLVVDNFKWNDTVGSGLAFGGTAAPTTFACSGYSGRGQFGVTGFGGFSAAINSGDCNINMQTVGSNNTNPMGLNFIASTADTIGLHTTPVNSSTNTEKIEVTGALSLTAVSAGSTSTGTYDFSGATQLKVPVAAAYVSAANGEIGQATTTNNWHLWANGADRILAWIPTSGITNGDCTQFSLSSGILSLADAGGACGIAGGGGPPTGAAGGDLSGTYPNPGVAKVNGASLPIGAATLATNGSGQIVAGTGGGAWANITGAVTVTGCAVSGSSCAVSGSSTSVVTFSVIPAHARLQIVVYGTSSANAGLKLTVNGDTAGNYWQGGYFQQNAANPAANNVASATGCNVQYDATTVSSGIYDFPFYADTSFAKPIHVHSFAAASISTLTNNYDQVTSCAWNNTAAITSTTFTLSTGNLTAGTKFMILAAD